MNREQADGFLAAARIIAEKQEAAGESLMPERCWSALWHVMLGGGLRPGEAFALQWGDLDETAKAVQVRRNLVRVRGTRGYLLLKPKTKKSRRTVPLPASAWQELTRWRTVQKRQRLLAGEGWQDLGFVFTTSKGGPLHGARRSFERVSATAGLGEWGPEPAREHLTGPLPARPFTAGFRIYDLRHTYVTLLLLNGVPVNVVADLAGHENAAFTVARYGHSLKQHADEATKKLESLLFRTA